MDYLVIVGALLLSYILIRITIGCGKSKNLPPGPTQLPIIGNLHLVGDKPHESLAKLAKIHGPIMSLRLGRITTLVISSAEAAKEVLQKQDLAFSSRYIPDAMKAGRNHSQYSIVWLPVDSQWRMLRKILNNNIFSKNALDANQHLRSQKVNELIAYCTKASQCNDPVNIGHAAFVTTMNLLSNTIFSKDMYQDSVEVFKNGIENIMFETGRPNVVDFFPVLKKMDPQRIRRRVIRHVDKLIDIFERLIEERLGIGGSNQNDVMGVCLKISQENPNQISREHIHSLFSDLFGAGTDTSSSTLEWAMAEVQRNPLIMKKAKAELEQVIGKGKIVQEDDISNLPYLSCIVKETLRMHPPVPFLIPRKVDKQVKLNGYTIPENTRVLVNVYAIGRDPAIWEDSQEFKPERFLASKVDVMGQDFELIPFGAGRRKCPGLLLAVRIIPMMLGSLLNSFDWKVIDDTPNDQLDMTDKFGFTLQKAIPLCLFPIPLN